MIPTSFIWIFISTLIFYQVKQGDCSTPAEITQWAYEFRQVAFPPALKMPCLTWNTAFATTAATFTSTCTLPNDPSFITDVRANTNDVESTFLNIFGMWLAENDNYDTTTAKCNDGLNCDRYLTFYNDLANEFGCSQAVCTSVPGSPASATPYMYSVCKFDKPKQAGLPYVASDTGCTATSCPTNKPVCFASNICCTSSDATCTDNTGVSCSTGNCDGRPGTFLKKCKKTCNNCDLCACRDSNFFDCAYYQKYQYCTKYEAQMIEFCPVTCNYCSKVKATNCP